MDALERAPSAESLASLSAFLDLQERWEARQRKAAYDAAFARFKAAAPAQLPKTKKADRGKAGKYWYTPIETAVQVLEPYLRQEGFQYSWSQEVRDGVVYVSCTLTHEAGHAETNGPVGAAPNNQKGNTPAQAAMGTITTLQRVTFLGITGVICAEIDTDDNQRGQANDQREQTEERDIEREAREELTRLRPRMSRAQQDWVSQQWERGRPADGILKAILPKLRSEKQAAATATARSEPPTDRMLERLGELAGHEMLDDGEALEAHNVLERHSAGEATRAMAGAVIGKLDKLVAQRGAALEPPPDGGYDEKEEPGANG
jgi:hypothetical protein